MIVCWKRRRIPRSYDYELSTQLVLHSDAGSKKHVDELPTDGNQVLDKSNQGDCSSTVGCSKYLKPESGKVAGKLVEDGRSITPLITSNAGVGKMLIDSNSHDVHLTTSGPEAKAEVYPMARLDVNPRVKSTLWAVIPAIWSHLKDSLNYHEIVDYLRRYKKDLLFMYKNEGSHQSPDTIRDGRSGADDYVKHRLDELTMILWGLNVQILKYFVPGKPSRYYAVEAKSILKWFHDFISRCQKYHSMSYPNPYSPYQQWLGLDQGEIYKMITQAIHATAEMDAYHISCEEFSKNSLFISNSQRLMSEAVIGILGYYHKYTNQEKWKFLFRDNNNFTVQLANMCYILKQEANPALRIENSRQDLSVVIPWVNPCSSAMLNSMKKDLNHEQLPFEIDVRAVFQEQDISEMQNFAIRKLFVCRHEDDIIWAWISRVKVNSKVGFEKFFQPTSESIIRNVRSYLSNLAGEMFSGEKQKKIQEKSDEEVLEILTLIFDILWVLNGKLIESFGGQVGGPDYFNEQRSVQLYFISRFFPVIIKISEPKPNKGNQIQHDQIMNLMIDLFLSKKNEQKFLVNHTDLTDSKSTILTNRDILSAKIVTSILGNYYKNQNQEKWTWFFDSNDFFFNHLINKSSNLFHRTSDKNKRTELWKTYKPYDVFPWKNPIDLRMPKLKFKAGSRGITNIDRWLQPLT
ncbi:hypothetical protein PGT21_010428 [Puccinia graminis f. sp. tritici]|uniref:Uncharacterized protein n=1 Tax=Puccinia graminis f. sp. tritici TaxID=56615 RepID=A0A5B0S5E3_PUCGR|nr:hypothetical protein PGT21_010428 [Puccinia graminis f. sp. tritici]KAA1133416.1 hypothetical protein PGTUg99_005612 [Puccinia graminis f. sp. tritici]